MNLSKKPYKGCRDFFPEQMRCRNFLFENMKRAAEKFAFEPYDGPLLEEVELYKAKSGEELINEQIYSFTDRGDRQVAIRPEMTPTVSRMVAQVHRETPKPIRWYSIPNLMRYEKPQRGRLREHWQFNADIFGAPENLGEFEIMGVIVDLMESFGATASMFSILINDRKVVDAVFGELLGLQGDAAYKMYKVIDKSKKVSAEALDKMIFEIMSDEAKISLFKEYLKLDTFGALSTFLKKNGLSEKASGFESFVELIQASNLKQYLKYDPTIVRGLDYYTGIVFEVFDLHPDNRRAIAGGGAYANLLQIFNEPALGGIGFGMGDVTLRDFLETHKLLPNFSTQAVDLFLCYFDDVHQNQALTLAQSLRQAGLKIELNLGAVKFNKVFKLAEKKNHQFVGMLGEDEIAKGQIQIKDTKNRNAENIDMNDIEKIKKLLTDKD